VIEIEKDLRNEKEMNKKLNDKVIRIENEMKIEKETNKILNEKVMKSMNENNLNKGKIEESLEKRLKISSDEIMAMKKYFEKRLENFQTVDEATLKWKDCEQIMLTEIKSIKLDKSLERSDKNDIFNDLKVAMNELKNEIKELKSFNKNTPKLWSQVVTNNTGGKEYGCADRDWWKMKKRKWIPKWCMVHKECGHTTDQCFNMKGKRWIVKKM